MTKVLSEVDVSVVMAAYNSEAYLGDAIESILSQTFKNFELIIVNDGSTDKTQSIICGYKDLRIRLVNQKNGGQVAARNHGIRLAKGQYVAIMDSDDISLPSRLEKEVDYLEGHPGVGAVGSNYIGFEGRKQKFVTNVFLQPVDLKLCMVTCNQFGHSSVMFRKSVLDTIGLYSNDSGGIVEDYDLLVRVSHIAEIANISEPLLKWRINPESITHKNLNAQIEDTFKIRDREFKRLLDCPKEYRLWSIKPDGQRYLSRKSTMYRNLAYLFRINSRLGTALKMMLFAMVCDPLNLRNYRRTALLLLNKNLSKQWGYEFL